jgi:hypothetical protein
MYLRKNAGKYESYFCITNKGFDRIRDVELLWFFVDLCTSSGLDLDFTGGTSCVAFFLASLA